jgi:BatD DUF11 like domain
VSPRRLDLLIPCVLLLVIAAGADEPGGRLNVAVRVDAASCYVGESVDVVVRVVAGEKPPVFEAPALPGASIHYLGMELTPLSLSGIGARVVTRSAYQARYRLVPSRAGALTIPPFRARIGDSRGTSQTVALTVKPTPTAGRPAEFLGGVGPFEVTAEGEPASIRVGQEIEYRVEIRGPGARGVNGPPDLSRLERLPLGLRVERRPDVVRGEPPSHTFVFRLRPTRAGAETLPPLRIAAFDPKASIYVTKATTGVPIRVADVPRFDSSKLVFAAVPHEGKTSSAFQRVAFAAALLVVAVGVPLAVEIRQRGRPSRERKRICRMAVVRIGREPAATALGRVIAEALAEYLGHALARPAGALTPPEAFEGITRATGCEALAERAAALVALSDAARFGTNEEGTGGLAAQGAAFFRDLERAEVVGRKTR